MSLIKLELIAVNESVLDYVILIPQDHQTTHRTKIFDYKLN